MGGMMRIGMRFLSVLVITVLWTVCAWAVPTVYRLDSQSSSLKFKARAALHSFTGTTQALTGQMTYDPEQDQLVSPAVIEIPVESLRTGNADRDQDMFEMFQAAEFPQIRFSATELVVPKQDAQGSSESRRYLLKGNLKIRTIEQPISLEVLSERWPDGTLQVSGEVPLTTTQFELKPPTVAGVIRVGKKIQVQFVSRWKAQSPR